MASKRERSDDEWVSEEERRYPSRKTAAPGHKRSERASQFRPRRTVAETGPDITLPANVPIQEARRNVRQGGLIISHQRLTPNHIALINDESVADLQEAKSTALVQSQQSLAALDNARRLLQDLPRALRRSRASLPDPSIAIHAFLSGAAIAGRSFRPHVQRIKVGGKYSSDPNFHWRYLFQAVDNAGTVRYFGTLREAHFDQQAAASIGGSLAEILNHWPHSLDAISANKEPSRNGKAMKWHQEVVFQAARVHANPNDTVPIRCAAPKLYTKGKTTLQLAVQLCTFNPTNFSAETTEIKLSLTSVMVDEVGDVPDGTLLLTYDNGLTWHGKDVRDDAGVMQFPTEIDNRVKDESKEKMRALERLGRNIILDVQGKVMDSATVKARASRLITHYGGAAGLANGAPLCYIYRSIGKRQSFLYPSTAAEKAGFSLKTGMSLPTADKTWFVPVIEKLESIYKDTGDLEEAFAEAALVNQAVLECILAKDRPPSKCECDEAQAKIEEHPCTGCLKAVLCNKRVRSPTGFLICRDCSALASTKFVTTTESFIYQFLAQRLCSSIRNEALALNRDYSSAIVMDNQKDCLAALKLALKGSDTGLTWRSALTHRQYTLSTEGSAWLFKTCSADPSPDAIMPYSAYNKVWYVHTRDNVWIIEQPLNFAKHVQLPGFMATIGASLRHFEEQSPTGVGLEDYEKTLVTVSRRFRKIRIKAGYTKKARIAKPFSRAKLDSDREEWVAGKLRQDDIGPWNHVFRSTDQYYQSLTADVPSDDMVLKWDSTDIQELRKVAIRYQDDYGVILPSKDGCPYFCSASSIPRGWNWLMAFRICTERFARMRDYCNRKGITIDTPKTIYVFCIIVACIQRCTIAADDPKRTIKEAMKKQYEEFLHLPVVLESVDGLRFVLGHLLHGRSMWTGVHPTSYNFDFPGGNVLVETCTSNYLKHDYPVQEYPLLLDLVRNIRMAQSSPYWNAERKINARVAAQDIADLYPEDFDVFDDLDFGTAVQEQEEGEEAEGVYGDSIIEGVD